MIRHVNLIGAGAALFFLASCAGHTHRLVPESDAPMLSGRLIHGAADQTGQLLVEREGKRFEGSFRIERSHDWQTLRERYRGAPRHWERINAGLDRGHEISAARAELKAPDGDALVCELVWPTRSKPVGVCTAGNGATLWLQFE